MTTPAFDKEPEDWRDYANCLGVDPDLFFPEKGESSSTARGAKAVCASCAVKAECLAYAVEHQIRFGVWGGTTPMERRAVHVDGAFPKHCVECGGAFAAATQRHQICSPECQRRRRRRQQRSVA